MSKSLEALKRIEHDMEYVTRLDFVEPIVRGEVQQELCKIYHREEKDLTVIEKELKALDIIKEKGIILQFIKETYTVEQYNAGVQGTLVKSLTQEEWDSLKEVLS